MSIESMHKAISLLKKIPKGRVATYGDLARACKTSPRAIGRIMATNPDPLQYPCYKVVSSKGELCGYSGEGGLGAKKKLLEKERILIVKGVIPREYFWEFT